MPTSTRPTSVPIKGMKERNMLSRPASAQTRSRNMNVKLAKTKPEEDVKEKKCVGR